MKLPILVFNICILFLFWGCEKVDKFKEQTIKTENINDYFDNISIGGIEGLFIEQPFPRGGNLDTPVVFGNDYVIRGQYLNLLIDIPDSATQLIIGVNPLMNAYLNLGSKLKDGYYLFDIVDGTIGTSHFNSFEMTLWSNKRNDYVLFEIWIASKRNNEISKIFKKKIAVY